MTNRRYRYLIVGGGMAADAAARGIRQVDPQGTIGLVGTETDPPYNRPPLSKGLWKTMPRPTAISHIWRGTESLGVTLHLGRTAMLLDPAQKHVVDSLGDEYHYERLLLATGGDPIHLGVEHKRIIYFRTLADYHRLRTLAETNRHFVVIGGGFVGSEIAAALAGNAKEVTMVFPETGIGARVLPRETAQALNSAFSTRGVRIMAGRLARSLEADETGVALTTDWGETVHADAVVAGLGIRPNTRLADQAGLAVDGGIIVDAFLQANAEGIYAAGDVVNFFSPTLGVRMRAEHEENANLGGLTAGQNMAGERIVYDTLPAVYSSLFDLSYDAVGELDPGLETVFDWEEPQKKGIIYYLKEGRVRGVILWNIPRGLEEARQLIAAPGPFNTNNLIGRIRG